MILGDTWPADYAAGYKRLYPPDVLRGVTRRKEAEARLAAALTCVTDDGRRLRPFPRVAFSPKVLADIERAERARALRDVLGVTA